jgi:hypothetical protein
MVALHQVFQKNLCWIHCIFGHPKTYLLLGRLSTRVQAPGTNEF